MSDSDTRSPSLAELFISFASISIMGFGGVMPWAHWMAVEKRNWLTPRQFSSSMALCQTLPGANILNFAVITGRRFHGPAGAAISVAALLLAPFFIVITLATFFAAYSDLPGLPQALRGIGAAGGGLVAALAAKMAVALDPDAIVYGAAGLAFLSVGVLRFPLIVTVAVLIPLLALYFWKRV